MMLSPSLLSRLRATTSTNEAKHGIVTTVNKQSCISVHTRNSMCCEHIDGQTILMVVALLYIRNIHKHTRMSSSLQQFRYTLSHSTVAPLPRNTVRVYAVSFSGKIAPLLSEVALTRTGSASIGLHRPISYSQAI